MSNNTPIKVLVAGDVNGKFSQLIKRVNTVNQKSGPFEMLICVGEFFGPNHEENDKVALGEVQFPISTYILGPCCPSTSQYYAEDGMEFSPSLTYLGKKGVLNSASGLTIGYLSGIELSGSANQANAFQFDEKTVDDLLMPVRASSGFLGLDILLTSMWPDQVSKHSPNRPSEDISGSKMISRLASGLKPRYHFAGRGCHYERSPYRNHRVLLEPAQHVTRFIGLASVDNPKKEKWLYAFSIVAMKKLNRAELTAQPPNASEFPYMALLEEHIIKQREKELKEQHEKGNAQFFYDIEANPDEDDTVDRGGRRKRHGGDYQSRPAKQLAPDSCWFCLSNNDAEKHLIVTVGSTCYMAMPKGPLTDDHVMVMSIAHVQSLVAASQEVRDEISRFRDAFALMCDKANKVPVLFERNYKTGHLQVQMVPVPKSRSKALRSTFFNTAGMKGIELTTLNEDQQLWDLVNEGQPYFYLELPDGTRAMTRQMGNFPLQFGREVLATAQLLNCEEKVDWKNCLIGKEKETELTQQLAKRFKPFDFTEEDSDED